MGSGISKSHELEILCEIGAIWGWIARERDIEIVFKGISTSLTREIVNNEGITESELRLAGRSKKVSKPWRLFCQLAVGKMGYPGAQVAHFLGVTTSDVKCSANSEEIAELNRYL